MMQIVMIAIESTTVKEDRNHTPYYNVKGKALVNNVERNIYVNSYGGRLEPAQIIHVNEKSFQDKGKYVSCFWNPEQNQGQPHTPAKTAAPAQAAAKPTQPTQAPAPKIIWTQDELNRLMTQSLTCVASHIATLGDKAPADWTNVAITLFLEAARQGAKPKAEGLFFEGAAANPVTPPADDGPNF